MRVSAAFVDLLKELDAEEGTNRRIQALRSRYELDPTGGTGETYLYRLAEAKFQDSQERAARKLLIEFRKGVLGKFTLELPPALPAESTEGLPSENAIA